MDPGRGESIGNLPHIFPRHPGKSEEDSPRRQTDIALLLTEENIVEITECEERHPLSPQLLRVRKKSIKRMWFRKRIVENRQGIRILSHKEIQEEQGEVLTCDVALLPLEGNPRPHRIHTDRTDNGLSGELPDLLALLIW